MAYADHNRDYNNLKSDDFLHRPGDMSVPSRVLFVRNLPNEATEQEVAMLASPFGRIRYFVLTKQRNQALIEMEDIEGAGRILNYYSNHSPALRGASLQVFSSTRTSLHVDRVINPTVDMAIRNANGAHDQIAKDLVAGKRILFLQVENQSYPITLEVLHTIFSKSGFVEKIVIFHKEGKFSAFIQMAESVEAGVAKSMLNGQNIYDGCCTLRIEFSKNRSLSVKVNTDKQRDYTRNDVPVQSTTTASASSLQQPSSAANPTNPISAMMNVFAGVSNPTHNPPPSGAALPVVGASLMGNLTPQQVAFAALMAAAASGGNMNMETLFAAAAAAQAGVNSNSQVDTRDRDHRNRDKYRDSDRSHSRRRSRDRSRRRSRDRHSRSRSRSRSHSRLRGGAAPQAEMRGELSRSDQLRSNVIREASNTGEPGPCILVTNLDDQRITCEDLFNLFGSYGDVQRLKILYKKKNTAIMQFSDTQQAQAAMNMLHSQPLYGRRMRIVFSKHETISAPDQELNPEQAALTRDYSNSALHRFKKRGSKNYQNIFPPSATLHLSNILCTDTSDDRIRDLFIEKGFHVRNFRWIGNDRKQAVISLETVEEGIMAIAKLHNYEQADRTHLKVSFSKQIDRPDFDR